LAQDLQLKGDIYQWLIKSSGLSGHEVEAIAERTQKAFTLLQAGCESGSLKLDLNPADFLYSPVNRESKKEHSCRPL
jgi:hypothetical protein